MNGHSQLERRKKAVPAAAPMLVKRDQTRAQPTYSRARFNSPVLAASPLTAPCGILAQCCQDALPDVYGTGEPFPVGEPFPADEPYIATPEAKTAAKAGAEARQSVERVRRSVSTTKSAFGRTVNSTPTRVARAGNSRCTSANSSMAEIKVTSPTAKPAKAAQKAPTSPNRCAPPLTKGTRRAVASILQTVENVDFTEPGTGTIQEVRSSSQPRRTQPSPALSRPTSASQARTTKAHASSAAAAVAETANSKETEKQRRVEATKMAAAKERAASAQRRLATPNRSTSNIRSASNARGAPIRQSAAAAAPSAGAGAAAGRRVAGKPSVASSAPAFGAAFGAGACGSPAATVSMFSSPPAKAAGRYGTASGAQTGASSGVASKSVAAHPLKSVAVRAQAGGPIQEDASNGSGSCSPQTPINPSASQHTRALDSPGAQSNDSWSSASFSDGNSSDGSSDVSELSSDKAHAHSAAPSPAQKRTPPSVPAFANWSLVAETEEKAAFRDEPVPRLDPSDMQEGYDYEAEEIRSLEAYFSKQQSGSTSSRSSTAGHDEGSSPAHFYDTPIPVESLPQYDLLRDFLEMHGATQEMAALDAVYAAHRTARANVEAMADRGQRLLRDMGKELQFERDDREHDRAQLEEARDEAVSERDQAIVERRAWQEAAETALSVVPASAMQLGQLQQQVDVLLQEKMAWEQERAAFASVTEIIKNVDSAATDIAASATASMMHTVCMNLAERTAMVAALQEELAFAKTMLAKQQEQ